MSEYGEPLRLSDCGHIIESNAGQRICTGSDPEELQRIVDCVNACVGIPTEKLTDGVSLWPGLVRKTQHCEDVENEYGLPPGSLRLARTPLQWRKEPPDKPGWWWMKSKFGETIRKVGEACGHFSAEIGHRFVDVSDPCFFDCEWAGPIEPPPRSET